MAKKDKSISAESAAEQPYYLQRAHIKDFRSIRDAVVEFKPGLNIIIGPNGSGKTNFVRCVESGIDWNIDNFFGGDGSSFYLIGEQKSLISYYSTIQKENKKPNTINIYKNLIQKHIVLKADKVIAEGTNLADALDSRPETAYLDFSDFYGHSIISINHGIPYKYVGVDGQLDLSLDQEGWSDFKEKGGFISTSLNSTKVAIYLFLVSNLEGKALKSNFALSIAKKMLNNWITSLKPYLSIFSPIKDLRLSNTVQAYENTSQQEILIQGIRLEFKINNDWLPFSALSSGTQRMFYIISETTALSSLEIEYFGSKQFQDIRSKVILLEEPELGIHPDQLHLLLNFLREQSQKHQLIITTHSPQVLDMLNDDELDRITICELHKTKGTQFRKLKKTQIAAAKQYMSTQGLYLSDYWRYGSLESTH